MIVTKVTASPHLLRLAVAAEAEPDVVTITNASLLAQMSTEGPGSGGRAINGPLRSLFNVSGLSAAQARARCKDSANIKYSAVGDGNTAPPVVTFYGLSIDITVDGAGAPQLVIALSAPVVVVPIILDVEFRHSEGK